MAEPVVNHQVYTQLIKNNVRVEVVYEHNPFFAGEELSIILRLRHLGDKQFHDPFVKPEPQPAWKRLLFGEEKPKENKNLPVDFMSGFVQLSGVMKYDSETFNEEKMNQLKDSLENVEGKLGGMLEKNDVSLISSLSKNIGSLLNTSIDELGNSESQPNSLPFFRTPQALLFADETLASGNLMSWYFKCQLPRDIPPSYYGVYLSLVYKLDIVLTMDDGGPQQISTQLPLKIAPYINSAGYQPVMDLAFRLLNVTCMETHTVKRHRKGSFHTVKAQVDTALDTSQREKFVDLIKQHDLTHVDALVDQMVDRTSTVKENMAMLSIEDRDEQGMEQQVTKKQTTFQIAKENKDIATVRLNRPWYKVGDAVDVDVEFAAHVSGMTVKLEHYELIKQEFMNDHKKPLPTLVSYREFATFDTRRISAKLNIPYHRTSQFRTNIFQNKFMLTLKFVIIDQPKMMEIYQDANGVLCNAKPTLDGEEFTVHLPLIVLPTDKDFGKLI